MLAIGLMSGTSLDGIDAVLVELEEDPFRVKELAFCTQTFSKETKSRIKQACDPKASTTPLISSLNMELGDLSLKACQSVLKLANRSERDLDFVASHGQTIWHDPMAKTGAYSSTFQIGESAMIAYGLKTQVIDNFRVMDLAAGGEGAPLVPYAEYLLYRSENYTRLLQNIGGIGNVTVLPKHQTVEDVIAFDTGPGNMVVDALMEHFYQVPYDVDGNVARSGKAIPELSQRLQQHPYLAMQPPKSTGREQFGAEFVKTLLATYGEYPPEDLIYTLTDFTAYSVALHYQRFVFPKYPKEEIEIILAGGGTHNTFLRERLQHYLVDCSIKTQEELGYSSDSKEAVAFALLGYATLTGQPSNFCSVTGAKRPVILGKITPCPYN